MGVFLEALAVTGGDLLAGLALAITIATVAWLIRQEARQADRENEDGTPIVSEADEDELDLSGVWNFPPKWSPPEAESDLGDVSGRRAA